MFADTPLVLGCQIKRAKVEIVHRAAMTAVAGGFDNAATVFRNT
jgi:hypothetical protein